MQISDKFKELQSKNEAALVLFVTAGDPSLDDLPEILDALQEGGADLLEVGIPFSDPIADGPTIQASSQRALNRGVTPEAVFAMLANCSLRVPTILMGYYNPLLKMGQERFAKAAKEAGASGTIITDLIPEEANDWAEASHNHGLDTIFLAAPTSTDQRLQLICNQASGFVYAVSRTGVTGADSGQGSDAVALVTRLKSCTRLPICVGFGISTPDDVRSICQVADGAVVGSSLVRLLEEKWDDGQGRSEIIRYVASLKAATRR